MYEYLILKVGEKKEVGEGKLGTGEERENGRNSRNKKIFMREKKIEKKNSYINSLRKRVPPVVPFSPVCSLWNEG